MAIPLNHHAEMLSDRVRLDLYERAINKIVQKQDDVVDIGSGFGLLAAFAAARTSGRIWSIEYFDEVASVGRELFHCDSRHNVISARSYDVEIGESPDVLVTETIGPVGPEENIVELAYDFKQRHPGIREIVPRKLALYAQPVQSNAIDAHFHGLMKGILSANSMAFQIKNMTRTLEEEYCRQVHQDNASDSTKAGVSYLLAEYQLGVDSSSSIQKSIRFGPIEDWNAVNIYFEAELADGITLSNAVDSELTHWMHSFVRRPQGKSELLIEYSDEDCRFRAAWKE